MLAQVSGVNRVCASMMHLPFGEDVFDVVISGLALGHTTSVHAWMAEAARVLAPGGTLLYSDFHPEAARAGLPRSFKDLHNRIWTVPHSRHELSTQKEAAAAANLSIEIVYEVRVGIELQETFSKSDDFYGQWHGLPIVLIVRATKQC
jgi:ubiquinone/menaquinone biosynthesis C-methylase UbiE